MKWLFTFAALMLFARTALAQTTGTITVTGSTPTDVSVTNTTDGTLTSTVALGSLTPAAGGTLMTSTVQARLRSNKAYTLSAQASALSISSPAAADGGASISLGDIGFGVTAI